MSIEPISRVVVQLNPEFITTQGMKL